MSARPSAIVTAIRSRTAPRVQAWQRSRREGAEPWAHELLYEPVDPAAYEEQLREQDALDMKRLGFAIVAGTILASLGGLAWLGWHLRGWVR